jgi:2-oxoisovalerate dehydrogenase E2 component (dihydrolipoyl transacylase)
MSTFNLPDLGEGLAEAEIVAWHVKVGDTVRVDQAMVSVETAKAVVEVPTPFSGVVTALRGQPGDIIATGAPLIDFDSGTVVGKMPAMSDEVLEQVAGNAQPSRHRMNHGNGRGGTIRAVPAARALAKHLHIPLESVSGSGNDGLILLDDIAALSGAASPKSRALTPTLGAQAEPLRGVRRAMAQSMSLSRDEVPGSTICDDADIHPWRQQADYMLRLMRALVSACRVEPALNAWYDGHAMARILHPHVHLAVAVDTEDGLIVPVVRDIDKKSPDELRASLAAQKTAARQRRIAPEDLRDFTLMLSNFGTLAGRYGIPLVVPPAVAILGAGKVCEDAVVVNGAVVARWQMPLSLSFDHRCVTGGEACRFLAAVIADLEKTE